MSHSNVSVVAKDNIPSQDELHAQLAGAGKLVDDIILKNYLNMLSNLDIIPLSDEEKDIDDIRLFEITEMVYQKDEYATYKFASVFNSVQHLNCSVFVIADSDCKESNFYKTKFYMGVRSLDTERTVTSLEKTLESVLVGQFPGVKTKKFANCVEMEKFLHKMETQNISTVSCVANNKDAEFKDNEKFIQGLEKLALAMQGKRYTAVILAQSASAEYLAKTRRAVDFFLAGIPDHAS